MGCNVTEGSTASPQTAWSRPCVCGAVWLRFGVFLASFWCVLRVLAQCFEQISEWEQQITFKLGPMAQAHPLRGLGLGSK